MSYQVLNDPNFWDASTVNYKQLAQNFTVPYAERALAEAALPAGSRVLDVATGNGALAFAAARAGLNVLATDFSQSIVDAVLATGAANVEARRTDGQAMDLPDASFDAAFSMFGVMLFADWRAGLSEMARVVRPGGVGSVGTWKDPGGAAATLLLAKLCDALFSEVHVPTTLHGMVELGDAGRFRAAMEAAGFADVRIVEETHDYLIDDEMLADPDRLFIFSPLWPKLDAPRREAVLAAIRAAQDARGGVLPVPSPALIATARRLESSR